MFDTRITPDDSAFENVSCYLCGGEKASPLTDASEDLTGKPGVFKFVTCDNCGLAYQNPRIRMEYIPFYYDDEYIAHRKKKNWGPLTPLYNWAMGKHDRQKMAFVSKYSPLDAGKTVLDVGCAAGTFLQKAGSEYSCRLIGVDFKDLSAAPGMEQIDFHCGLFSEQDFKPGNIDLITMWHFLEHDYEPLKSLHKAAELLSSEGRLIIEVPRLDSLTFDLYKERWPGLQAPQHTVLYNWQTLRQMLEKAGFEVIEQLPYGAFPAYFYLFAGAAFKLLKGRGLNLSRAIYPYFLGQLLLSPLLLFEKRLNLAMQTIICKKQP